MDQPEIREITQITLVDLPLFEPTIFQVYWIHYRGFNIVMYFL